MASRDITSAVATELAKRRVAPVYLFDLEFDSGTTYLWSGVGDLPWNGNTYQGAGNLLDFNPPAETTDVRAEGAQVSLSGIPAAWISTALAEPYQGRTAKQYLGFMRLDYDLDQTVTTAADSTSNNNNGTLVNDPQWTADEVTDQIVGALSFDGVDQSVDYGGSDFFDLSPPYTVESWVWVDPDFDLSNQWIPFGKYDGNGWIFRFISGTFQLWEDGTPNKSKSYTPDKGTWIHWAAVHDDAAGEIRFLVGGALFDTVATASSPSASAVSLFGMQQGNDAQFAHGRAADQRIWNVARTQQQIQDNMNKRLTGDETGLVLYAKLDDGLLDKAALINDPITLFTGRMDQMQIEEEGDTSTIAVTLESNLIDLNKPRERRYTDQDQKSDYPNDRGFEYVAGLQGKSLTWGPDTRSPRQRTQDIARIREDVTLQRRTTRGYNTLRTTTTSAVDDEGNVLESFSETTGSPGGR